ncbi:hypothetical protein [Aquimarina sp. 2201CG5-10]|uniref:hypothetical protein n=1 Tax=Aquimarina callyspongiae TaxID=3098150 RepID=UPI002AB586C9|nr:hypothetical protein [Aquimarina sp. 2201CG5-10]MDY8138985.1 hypothetical protein [Aquimarina sp. 2201CG5-10]
MVKLYNLDFCKLEIHHNHMIAVMNEGIIVDSTNNSILIKIAEKHYKDTPFVYITHRINSYAVDPIIYIKTAQVTNLVGFAVVSKNPMQKIQTKLEKSLFNKEFRYFDDMNSALKWKDEIIGNYKKNIISRGSKKKRIN